MTPRSSQTFYARCFVLAGTVSVTSLRVLILAISFLQLFQPVYAREHRVSIPRIHVLQLWEKVRDDLSFPRFVTDVYRTFENIP